MAQTHQTSNCPNCGKPMIAGAKACVHCGWTTAGRWTPVQPPQFDIGQTQGQANKTAPIALSIIAIVLFFCGGFCLLGVFASRGGESPNRRAFIAAQVEAKLHARYPDEVELPLPMNRSTWDTVETSRGVYRVRSFIIAKNGFGVRDRLYFDAEVRIPPGDTGYGSVTSFQLLSGY